MKKLYILKSESQADLLYMNWFCESWEKSGAIPVFKKNNLINRLFCIFPKRLKITILKCSQIKAQNKYDLIVPMGGGTCFDDVFPFCSTYNIIPYIWDCWPRTWDHVVQMIQSIGISKCFISSSMVCKELSNRDIHTDLIYIPEGININYYIKGKQLINRIIDVLELGRIHQIYHNTIKSIDGINFLYNKDDQFVFPLFSDLVKGLSQTKIVICFPRSATHQSMAGSIETLTQRYWECMLSRCLIIGKAPFELVDILGYNPVIDVEYGKEKEQISSILSNISLFQDLVDKNYSNAIKYASWDNRVKDMKQYL